jgi:NADPH:quinone reductase-like Zn-dependent oxidoreductase
VPLAGLAALQALADHAGVQAGDHVLVHGAAGGVGSLGVQIAVAMGARVTATASGDSAGFVISLGADRVIDHRTTRFEKEVSGVDVVLDCVGGETQARSWEVMRPGGVLVSLVQPPDERVAARYGIRAAYFVVEPDSAGLETLTGFIEDGRLVPRVDRIVPLSATRAAYEALDTEHHRGKIVISVAEEEVGDDRPPAPTGTDDFEERDRP